MAKVCRHIELKLSIIKIKTRCCEGFNFENVLKSTEPPNKSNFKDNPRSLMISHVFVTKSRIFEIQAIKNMVNVGFFANIDAILISDWLLNML